MGSCRGYLMLQVRECLFFPLIMIQLLFLISCYAEALIFLYWGDLFSPTVTLMYIVGSRANGLHMCVLVCYVCFNHVKFQALIVGCSNTTLCNGGIFFTTKPNNESSFSSQRYENNGIILTGTSDCSGCLAVLKLGGIVLFLVNFTHCVSCLTWEWTHSGKHRW